MKNTLVSYHFYLITRKLTTPGEELSENTFSKCFQEHLTFGIVWPPPFVAKSGGAYRDLKYYVLQTLNYTALCSIKETQIKLSSFFDHEFL